MSRLREVMTMSDPRYTPKGYYKPGHCVSINTSTTDKQRTGDAAPLGYCPFSKHPCGTACALFNANLRRCGILAALEMR